MKRFINVKNAAIFAVLFLVISIVLGYVFSWSWTGVSTLEYSKESNQEIKQFKTLWDWMQLLIIPLALLGGGYILNKSEKDREIEAAKERANLDRKLANEQRELDREIAKIKNEEIALSEYIDRMSQLILERKLLEFNEPESIRNVARTRTISIFNRLTEKRITI